MPHSGDSLGCWFGRFRGLAGICVSHLDGFMNSQTLGDDCAVKSQTGPVSTAMGRLLWPSKPGTAKWRTGANENVRLGRQGQGTREGDWKATGVAADVEEQITNCEGRHATRSSPTALECPLNRSANLKGLKLCRKSAAKCAPSIPPMHFVRQKCLLLAPTKRLFGRKAASIGAKSSRICSRVTYERRYPGWRRQALTMAPWVSRQPEYTEKPIPHPG